MNEVRCKKCGKKIAEVDAKEGKIAWPCPRCHTYNVINLDKLHKLCYDIS